MKKAIVLFITILQLTYWVKVGLPGNGTGEGNVTAQFPVVETCGISSLFTIVCTNTLDTLRQITNLADLVSTLPQPKKQPLPSQKKTQMPSAGLLPTWSPLSQTKGALLPFDHIQATVNKKISGGLASLPSSVLYLFLWGIFLYLFRLKFFCLNPRSTIDDSIMLGALLLGTGNPRVMKHHMRVFLLPESRSL